MKRQILLGIFGLGLTCQAVFSQGGIYIHNYQAPYNAVLYSWGDPVRSTDGVILTLWWGEGVLDSYQLNFNTALNWDLDAESHGYEGYYYGTATLFDWDPGDTYTFQVRATGNSIYGQVSWSSILWEEKENILYIGGDPPGILGISAYSIGTATPEPSVFALICLGLTGLALTRRR